MKLRMQIRGRRGAADDDEYERHREVETDIATYFTIRKKSRRRIKMMIIMQ
jgi:hypothetical protein